MRDIIEALQAKREIVEIKDEVRYGEVVGIAEKYNNKTILFHNVDDKGRVVVNLINSMDRLSGLLNINKEKFTEEIHRILFKKSDNPMIRKINMPETITEKPVDLTSLPILKHFPDDPGRYITGGVLVSEYNDIRNASVHRMLLLDEKRLAVRLVAPRHAYTLFHKAETDGKDLPVAVLIGVDPSFLFASSSRVPLNEEYRFASLLKGGLDIFELNNGVCVPEAEITLEGYIRKEERAKEGPFFDITGKYDIVRDEPVIEITNMYVKNDPIYHAIIPAGIEHKLLMGMPYLPIIYNACLNAADVKNVYLTEGGFHYFNAIVQIKKQTEGDPKNVIMAAFSADTSLKNVVVVDDDVNIYDAEQVEEAISLWVRWDRDILLVNNVRGSSLDPTISENGTGAKLGIDATKPLKTRSF